MYLVAKRLGPLNDRVVFVGGCATGLVIDDDTVVSVRATKDVDVIVEVVGRTQFHKLEKELRSLGFAHDPAGPICRWQIDSVLVDVMPDDEKILGFSNRWYRTAIETAEIRQLRDLTIRVVTPALFLATKLEAFRGRGQNDYLGSHDLEDFLAVIDGRLNIVRDCFDAPTDVRDYLRKQLTLLLGDDDFLNALPGYSVMQVTSPARDEVLRERMENIVQVLSRE